MLGFLRPFLSGGDATQDAIKHIHSDVAALGKSEFDAILAVAKKAKPDGYDADQEIVAKLFTKRQHEVTAAAMVTRYPKTHTRRPVYTLNTLKHSAVLDAQAYLDPPDRYVEVKVDEVWRRADLDDLVEEHGWRQRALDVVVEKARLDVLMTDWEEKTMASVDHFARIVPRRGRLEARLFWPHNIWVIQDEDHPGRIDQAHAIIARLPSYHEFWFKRVVVDNTTGRARTMWFGTHLSKDGKRKRTFDWPFELNPWFSMHGVDPQGSLWHEPNIDAARVNIENNFTLSSWRYREDFQAHQQVFIIGGGDLEGVDLTAGPGEWPVLPKPETKVVPIPAVLDKTPIEGAEAMLKMQGNANQQNPDSWMSEPGPPLSGVSREIRNEMSDRKRRRFVKLFEMNEADELLPKLARIARAGEIIEREIDEGDDVEVRIRAKLPPPRKYEDTETTRTRYSSGMRDGALSLAEYAHRAFPEVYANKQAAIDKGLSDVPPPPQAKAPASRARVPGSDPAPDVQDGGALNKDGEGREGGSDG